jgi:hypothetical protein
LFPLADLVDRAGVEVVVVVWGPTEAGVRCLGGIVLIDVSIRGPDGGWV